MPTVVIVEDEYIVALDIKKFLQKNGFTVSGIFASGEALFDKVAEMNPDIALLDIKIQGELDGVEVASRLRDSYDIPSILLTAYADDATIERAKLSGPFGYIIKPYEDRELKTAMEIALYRAGIERKLREGQERYRRLFEESVSANAIISFDGSIILANKSFRLLFRIVSGMPSSMDAFFVNPEQLHDAIARCKEGNSFIEEFPMKSISGIDIFAISAFAMTTSDLVPESRAVQVQCIDISQRRALEDQLRQAQKMDAIGRLAGSIAHDFNNILTVMLGYTNLLLEEKDFSAAAEPLNGIKKAVLRAGILTRQLLTFSRKQAFCPRLLEVDLLLAEHEKMLKRLLPADIALHVSFASSCTVMIDPLQFEQAIINLAVNARDAMPSGGDLFISSRHVVLEGALEFSFDSAPPGSYVLVTVEDTGIGIRPEDKNLIFEPFFTTKAPDAGTGLGLSTVYGIIKRSDGFVDVDSRLGSGTTFKIYIPNSVKTDSVEDAEPAPLPELSGNESILLVEDDGELRSLFERSLARLGYTVMSAANAGEAILIAETSTREIDLLVADVMLPIMDGVTLSRRISSMRPGISTIYMSGFVDRVPESIRSGEYFLLKPFGEDVLLSMIRAIMNTKKTASRAAKGTDA